MCIYVWLCLSIYMILCWSYTWKNEVEYNSMNAMEDALPVQCFNVSFRTCSPRCMMDSLLRLPLTPHIRCLLWPCHSISAICSVHFYFPYNFRRVVDKTIGFCSLSFFFLWGPCELSEYIYIYVYLFIYIYIYMYNCITHHCNSS